MAHTTTKRLSDDDSGRRSNAVVEFDFTKTLVGLTDATMACISNVFANSSYLNNKTNDCTVGIGCFINTNLEEDITCRVLFESRPFGQLSDQMTVQITAQQHEGMGTYLWYLQGNIPSAISPESINIFLNGEDGPQVIPQLLEV